MRNTRTVVGMSLKASSERADLMTGLAHLFHPNGSESEQATRDAAECGRWGLAGSGPRRMSSWGLSSWLLPFLFLLRSDPCLLWQQQLHHPLSMVSWDIKNHEAIIPISCSLECPGHTGQSAAHGLCCENGVPPALHHLPARRPSNFCPETPHQQW